MAKRDRVISKKSYIRNGAKYEVTEYSSGKKSTHVYRTPEQKQALMESASRQSHRKLLKGLEGKKYVEARREYDKAIKSINGSLSSAMKDKSYGDVTGDVESVINQIEDAISDTGLKTKRKDRFPSSKDMTDEQFTRFWNLASSVYIDSSRPIETYAYAGIRRSYRKDYQKVLDDFSRGAKGLDGSRIALSEETKRDAVRLALAYPSIWAQLRKEDRGYGEIDMILTTLRERRPDLSPTQVVENAYSSYVASGGKIPFINYLTNYINHLTL